ncbi:MAG: DUF402 domain-containing protein [SAR202 cluster bacterium]|jgi:protein associated with RNAse G/E|nr:DUF402 domain-containing protein [SAR202 cluster bacterium]MDP6715889.1 DUF402 domain-containing protein [SAR202 cluster bacterium]
MKDFVRGSSIQVISTRYGGALRDRYETRLVDYSESAVRLYVPAGTAMFGPDDRPVEPAEVAALEVYFTDRWYNVIHWANRITYKDLWYSNVAMPAEFDGSSLRWVDMDIDVACQGDGPLLVHDEDEFQENIEIKGISPELVERVLSARDEVMRLGKLGMFPFDHANQIQLLRELQEG